MRRDGGPQQSSSHGAVPATVLLCSALALASCQALGLSESLGPSANGDGSAGPSRAIVASASTRAFATAASPLGPGTSAPSRLSGDAAAAADIVAAYLDALASARYPDAWNLLALSARQAWGDEQQFANERGAFYESAGSTAVTSAPDNSAATLDAWILPSFDGNRRRAYVVNVDHPQIQSNASREVLVAAPDASGEWRIWIAR
jgi:hypothetical protein